MVSKEEGRERLSVKKKAEKGGRKNSRRVTSWWVFTLIISPSVAALFGWGSRLKLDWWGRLLNYLV